MSIFLVGGIYEPEAVDDLITWLEGNRRQEVVMHQITNQVGSLSPGQYITPRLMFPPHTLPGGSWHTFILGKLWGAIRGLGEIFSSIFGLFDSWPTCLVSDQSSYELQLYP